MSDHEIVFGTPEHIAGLSRGALEEDFRWINDRRMELEGECERLASENANMRELVQAMGTCKMVYNSLANVSRCVSCGERITGRPTNFCPNCGKRVVDE